MKWELCAKLGIPSTMGRSCCWTSTDEIKQIEKDIRNLVQNALTAAKAGKFPPDEWLFQDIYSTKDYKNEPVPFIRMPDYKKSIILG